MFKVIDSFFCVFKQPKPHIKMAAQMLSLLTKAGENKHLYELTLPHIPLKATNYSSKIGFMHPDTSQSTQMAEETRKSWMGRVTRSLTSATNCLELKTLNCFFVFPSTLLRGMNSCLATSNQFGVFDVLCFAFWQNKGLSWSENEQSH